MHYHQRVSFIVFMLYRTSWRFSCEIICEKLCKCSISTGKEDYFLISGSKICYMMIRSTLLIMLLRFSGSLIIFGLSTCSFLIWDCCLKVSYYYGVSIYVLQFLLHKGGCYIICSYILINYIFKNMSIKNLNFLLIFKLNTALQISSSHSSVLTVFMGLGYFCLYHLLAFLNHFVLIMSLEYSI